MDYEEESDTTCPRCGKPNPEESLSCIYCGSRLAVRIGFLNSLGPPHKLGLFLATFITFVLILMWVVF